MKTRKFEYRLSGLPALLGIAFLGVVVLGITVVVVILGAAMAIAGLAVSAVAGIVYVAKRKLGKDHTPARWTAEGSPSGVSRAPTSTDVRVIEAEVIR